MSELTITDLESIKCETVGYASERTLAELDARFDKLSAWPTSLADSATDPRCGCGEDGEGAACYWDSTADLEDFAGILRGTPSHYDPTDPDNMRDAELERD